MKKMADEKNRVYLVSTPLEESFKIKSISDDENSYSLGLGYLHSVIENAGYPVKTENYNTSDEEEALSQIKKNIAEFRPRYLLLQMFSMNRRSAYKAIKLAKELDKEIKMVAGGVHATIMYEQLLKNFEIDVIVLGEGEETIIELLNAFENNSGLGEIKGIAYLRDGKVIKNSEREMIKDLDKLPFPKHELFITPKRKMACLLTSRGCPFKCNFCCLHLISKRIYRKRSVQNMVSEVEYIIKNFPNIEIIQIADDTFTLDQERAIDFCKEIVARGIKIKFYCSARIKPSSRELFEAMESAGFVAMGFGLETGSEKLLKSIHKNITHEDIKKTLRDLGR